MHRSTARASVLLVLLVACRGDMPALEARIAELEAQSRRLQSQLEDHGRRIQSAQERSDTLNLPLVSGAVTNVIGDGRVEINRGRADNIQTGWTMEVYSGGRYKGRVRVVDVRGGRSFCIIEELFEGRSIAVGDSVTNDLGFSSPGDIVDLPHVVGRVLQVITEAAPGFLTIDRGSADLVQRGFQFQIYSGGRYKGRVRVVDVQENQCFAVIELTTEDPVEPGDSASTHL